MFSLGPPNDRVPLVSQLCQQHNIKNIKNKLKKTLQRGTFGIWYFEKLYFILFFYFLLFFIFSQTMSRSFFSSLNEET